MLLGEEVAVAAAAADEEDEAEAEESLSDPNRGGWCWCAMRGASFGGGGASGANAARPPLPLPLPLPLPCERAPLLPGGAEKDANERADRRRPEGEAAAEGGGWAATAEEGPAPLRTPGAAPRCAALPATCAAAACCDEGRCARYMATLRYNQSKSIEAEREIRRRLAAERSAHGAQSQQLRHGELCMGGRKPK